eukprot:TRINITY_DN3035_c0_g2_i1.p1 TRINITY_DN3035_c0_g2~~TRINITY_DN3035_c0_g2_i1.p1  ORF type:complete len:126 (+),score=8.78 TRINITY_DN3035_c0_g2_i1:675-1052(+)
MALSLVPAPPIPHCTPLLLFLLSFFKFLIEFLCFSRTNEIYYKKINKRGKKRKSGTKRSVCVCEGKGMRWGDNMLQKRRRRRDKKRKKLQQSSSEKKKKMVGRTDTLNNCSTPHTMMDTLFFFFF